jgi:hypothetical protein
VQLARTRGFAGFTKLYRGFESLLLPPPNSLGCREIRLPSSEICAKSQQFLNICSQTGPEKVSCFTLSQVFMRFSLNDRHAVRFQRLRRANAIRSQNRWCGESDLTFASCPSSKPRAASGLVLRVPGINNVLDAISTIKWSSRLAHDTSYPRGQVVHNLDRLEPRRGNERLRI